MARQSKKLVKEAGDLGIEVDGRWGDETIQEAIDAKRAELAALEKKEGLSDGVLQDAGPDAGGQPEEGAAGSGQAENAGGKPAADAAEVSDAAATAGAGADHGEAGKPAAENGSSDGDPTGAAAQDVTGEASGSDELDDVEPTAVKGPPPVGVSAEEWAELIADPMQTLVDALELATGAPSAAYDAGTAVYEALTPAIEPGGDRWFCDEDTAALDAHVALILVVVPFVRTWPEAPTEALYGHTAKGAPALALATAWPDLSPAARAAWETFRDVLIKVDAMQRREASALARLIEAPRRRFSVAADETTLEAVDGPEDLSELGRMMAARS
ncbi:hypothetical protein GTW51_10115 [Aurantimonas aggregata]|uniref:Uncharacterized protein n=1 Tax=Aurantimonas aggregata TaxID=2047720 RepID=A0A6L9MHB8_9HYPH|nr:hypothetical protein [Aurantimonas aggregata]NDV87056.1 hypothetical protein [Aurantimonas aggregata]